MMDEPTLTTTTDGGGGEAPTPMALPTEEESVIITSEDAVAIAVAEAPTISVSEVPIVDDSTPTDGIVPQNHVHDIQEAHVNALDHVVDHSQLPPTAEETVDAVAAAVASQVPTMPPVSVSVIPNPQDLLVEAAAQHAAAAAANDASAAAAAAAASSILAPSEISAEVTAAAAAAAASLNGFSGGVGESDLMLSNEIAQTVLDAAGPDGQMQGDHDPNDPNRPPNFSHEQHLASRRMKDRERYASMTPDQREIYNSKRREQYHRQSEASRKKRRERERTRYHSLTQCDAKDRNVRRAALERERYKKLDPGELAARNARRRERAAALRAQKKAAAAAAAGVVNVKVPVDVTMDAVSMQQSMQQVVAPMVTPEAVGEAQAPQDAQDVAMMEQVVMDGEEVIAKVEAQQQQQLEQNAVVRAQEEQAAVPFVPLPNLPVTIPIKEDEAAAAAAQDKNLITEV